MNEERVVLPIKTERDGNKITKVCVEDIYKILNRISDFMDKSHNEATEIIDSVHKYYPEGNCSGELIIGTGVSQPCVTDAFDEEIGNNIAFMKAKLNANLKKHNLLRRIGVIYVKRFFDPLVQEIYKIDQNIMRDLNGIRKHNPDYLAGIEEKIRIINEVQEEA